MEKTSIVDTESGPVNQDQNTPARSLVELEYIVEKGLPTYQEVGAAHVKDGWSCTFSKTLLFEK